MKTIYIVDDDDDVREILSYALETDGHIVMAYANPKTALLHLLNLTQKEFPGMILVDYQMPELDGITFINEFRRMRPELKKIPTALNSASGTLEHSNKLPDDVILLTKPMDLDLLLGIIKQQLKL